MTRKRENINRPTKIMDNEGWREERVERRNELTRQ